MQLATNTAEGWCAVITDLTIKQQAARDHTERLRIEKQRLALEAAMGGTESKKRLREINAELARLTLEGDDWDAAITQAETAQRQAAQAESAAAERQRQEQLSRLASAAIRHATEYTAAMCQAVEAGASVKLVIQDMLKSATPQESQSLDRLLRPNPYMRGAEHAGLRNHLEFQNYPGPREHVVPLEEALAASLARWLNGREDAK